MSPLADFFFLVYKVFFRPVFGHSCHFYPSCSKYCLHAFKSHNIFYAVFLTSYRLLRCHPFASGGFDPVPERTEV